MNIEQRLERLERQNRNYKFGFLILGILTLVLVGLRLSQREAATAPATTVKATSFILVDSAGNERGNWSLDSKEPQLTMYGTGEKDKASTVYLGIMQDVDSPAFLKLVGSKHKTEVHLMAKERNCSSSVFAYDKTWRYAQMQSGIDQAAQWELNYGGETRVRAAAFPNNSAVSVFLGDQKKSLEVK